MRTLGFLYRFPRQRKDWDWVVMKERGGTIMAQTDNGIARFDPQTGKGRLCLKGSSFADLHLFGEDCVLPQDFVDKCKQLAKVDGLAVASNGCIKNIAYTS